MREEEKRSLKCLLVAALLLFPIPVSAASDCSNINTPEFLASASRDDLYACVQAIPDVFNQTDERGYNLLMTAVTSDIDPFKLHDLIEFSLEANGGDPFAFDGSLGRSLGRLAAAKATDPAVIFVLSRYGVRFWDMISEDEEPGHAGQNPLHIAARRDDGWPIVAALMSVGGEIWPDDNDLTPLDLAMNKPEVGPSALVLAGNWPELSELNSDGAAPAADVDCTQFLTSEFFREADQTDVVACLKNQNQLVAVDRNGDSVLHLAAANARDPWIVDQILGFSKDHVALLEKRNSFDRTSLHLAAEKGASPEVLLHLLAWGADPDALSKLEKSWGGVGGKRGISALHLAASRQDDLREDMILVLLAFHADTKQQDPSEKSASGAEIGGRTALHRALLQPDPRVVLMLLEDQRWDESFVGALYRDVVGKAVVKEIVDDLGRTALHIAASRSPDFDTLSLLVDYGFSIDKGDKQQITPLMFGAQNFTNADHFEYLLQNSDDPCGKSKTGVTVESALRSNEALMAIGANDLSGSTLTPLSKIKARCAQ